jgi:hypothetical protein
MAAMRITFLNVRQKQHGSPLGDHRFAFEHLHERVSVAWVYFLVRMPRHRLLAFRAVRLLDRIAHRVLHCLQAGAPGTVYATFPTAVSMCLHLGQTKVSSS